MKKIQNHCTLTYTIHTYYTSPHPLNTFLHTTSASSVPDPWHFGLDPDPRIHASDWWIRIRFLDPGSGSCYFRHWPSRCQKKTIYLSQFFLLTVLLFEGTFTSFFKDKKSKRVTKSKESRFFLLFLHDDGGSGSGSRRPNMWIRWIRIRNTGCKETSPPLLHTTTHNNTPQHTTTHHNTPQHTTTHNNTQQQHSGA